MASLEIEKKLISFALNDSKYLETNKILPDYLEDNKCRTIFKILVTYWKQYYELPSKTAFVELLNKEFSNTKDVEYYTILVVQLKNADIQDGDFNFICDSIISDYFHKKYVKMLTNSIDNLNEKNSKQNYEELVEKLLDLKSQDNDDFIKQIEFSKDIEQRITYYDEEKKESLLTGKMAGIPSGLTELDNLTGGWRPGELVIFMANSGEGKSIMLLNCAHNAYRHKANVMFVSLEMSYKEKLDRFHSMVTNIDYSKIRNRLLSNDDEKEYYKNLIYNSLKEKDRETFIQQYYKYINEETQKLDMDKLLEDVRKFDKNENYFYLFDISINCTAQDIYNELKKINKKHKIDVLVIDYLNIMDTSTKTNQDWIRQSTIARELKLMARNMKMTVLTAAQMGEVKEGEKISIQNMNYAKAIGHHVDYLIGYKANEQDRACHRIRLEIAKGRHIKSFQDGKKVIIPIKQMFDKMKVDNFYKTFTEEDSVNNEKNNIK